MLSEHITITVTVILTLFPPLTALKPGHLVVQGVDVLDHGGLLVLRELGRLQRRPAPLQPLSALLVLAQPQAALRRAEVQLVLQRYRELVLQRQLDVRQGRGVLTQVVQGGRPVTQGQA